MSKKTGLVIAGVVLAVLLMCGGAIGVPIILLVQATGEVAQGANDFFALLGDGKTDEAYASAASSLRAQLTPEEFAGQMARLGLTEYASSTWGSRKFDNDVGSVEGTITLKSGAAQPMKVSLVREGGVWRVQSLTGLSLETGDAPAEASKPAKPPMPSDDELREMATETLLAFDDAVKSEDFTKFHAASSSLLRAQHTPESIQEAFQPFIENQIDLAGIRDVRPEFDAPPAIDEDRALILSGYYPTQPTRVVFELRYLYEHPDWKLVAINVNVK